MPTAWATPGLQRDHFTFAYKCATRPAHFELQYHLFIIYPVMCSISQKELKANYELQTLSASLNDVINKPKIIARLACILKAAITITAFTADIKW